jgi:hypothetical protein
VLCVRFGSGPHASRSSLQRQQALARRHVAGPQPREIVQADRRQAIPPAQKAFMQLKAGMDCWNRQLLRRLRTTALGTWGALHYPAATPMRGWRSQLTPRGDAAQQPVFQRFARSLERICLLPQRWLCWFAPAPVGACFSCLAEPESSAAPVDAAGCQLGPGGCRQQRAAA